MEAVMDKEELYWMLKRLFKNSGKSERAIAFAVGMSPQNLNRKINAGTLRVVEFYQIIGALGYTVELKKKSEKER